MRFVQIIIICKAWNINKMCKSGPTTCPEVWRIVRCESFLPARDIINEMIISTCSKSLTVPAKCLSDVPLAPNFVTSFPFDWKMKTQQALLSTVMICPFLSTATPLGPISLPAPILFCDSQRDSLVIQQNILNLCSENIFFFLAKIIHLELSIRGEYANPSVVVVSYDYVTVHVHCDPRGALQLPWWTTSDPKPHLKLAVIWEYLQKEKIKLLQILNNEIIH